MTGRDQQGMRQMDDLDVAKARQHMVELQVARRGVRSQNVLDAMLAVPREAFLPPSMHEFAYEDSPLPIAEGQTISQPYIVAMMVEALDLQGGEDVLEIGTGSGYAAAVLSRIARNVYTVERIAQLAEKSASTLATLGYANVHVLHADGTRGWPEHEPFERIVVTAAAPEPRRSWSTNWPPAGAWSSRSAGKRFRSSAWSRKASAARQRCVR